MKSKSRTHDRTTKGDGVIYHDFSIEAKDKLKDTKVVIIAKNGKKYSASKAGAEKPSKFSIKLPKGTDLVNAELRGPKGELLNILTLKSSNLGAIENLNFNLPEAKVPETILAADRRTRMKSQAARMANLLINSLNADAAANNEQTESGPTLNGNRHTAYEVGCKELQNIIEENVVELNQVLVLAEKKNIVDKKKDTPSINNIENNLLRSFASFRRPTNTPVTSNLTNSDEQSTDETTENSETNNTSNKQIKAKFQQHVNDTVSNYIDASDEGERTQAFSDFREAITMAYAMRTLEVSGESRLDAEGLTKALSEAILNRAPSDVPAVHDHTAIRLALPGLMSSPSLAGVVNQLTTMYENAWKVYQDDRAWHIAEELPSSAQIEAMMNMAKGLIAPNELVKSLQELGEYSLTEESFARFTPEYKEQIGQAFSRLQLFSNVSTTEQALDLPYIRLLDSDNVRDKKDCFQLFTMPGSNNLVNVSGITYFISKAELSGIDFQGSNPVSVWHSTKSSPNSDGYSGDWFPEDELPESGKQKSFETATSQVFFIRLASYTTHLVDLLKLIVADAETELQDREDKGGLRAGSSLEALSLFLDSNGFSESDETSTTDSEDNESYRPPRFPFTTFTPRSINFGIKLDYRQLWIPLAYQAGDLVATIPLLPGETRKFSTKTVVKKDRKEKEIESSLRVIGDESSETGKVESEIAKKAQRSTQFSAHSEASGTIGPFSFGGSTDVGANASNDVSQAKKYLREATTKASQQYKAERKMEIETHESSTFEETTSGEIKNPNNELVMTALFYELQRRFFVTEVLGDVQPVVFVAGYVPPPSKISESFVIRHDWILRQRLLDDSFDDTFDLLKDTQVSRRIELGIRKKAVDRQLETLTETKQQLSVNTGLRDASVKGLKDAVDLAAATTIASGHIDEVSGILTGGLSSLFGGGTAQSFEEALENQEEHAREALQRVDREVNRLRTQMESNVSALDQAIESYSKVLRESLRREQKILRLRVHIAQNILYYMQAIWEFQIRDQQFFELFDICVPIIEESEGRNEVKIVRTAYLHEIADLDHLLGFKGNYLMFPLKDDNGITKIMAKGYCDLIAPSKELNSLLAGGPAADAIEMWLRNGDEDVLDEDFTEGLAKGGQVVVVPSGHTHVEALVGKHPVLEEFKLRHREIDVRKALAETQNMEAEHLRRMLRMLDNDLTDPDVVKNTLHISNEGSVT